jgi:hypothetical protein
MPTRVAAAREARLQAEREFVKRANWTQEQAKLRALGSAIRSALAKMARVNVTWFKP